MKIGTTEEEIKNGVTRTFINGEIRWEKGDSGTYKKLFII